MCGTRGSTRIPEFHLLSHSALLAGATVCNTDQNSERTASVDACSAQVGYVGYQIRAEACNTTCMQVDTLANLSNVTT